MEYDQQWSDLNSSELYTSSISLRFVSDNSWKRNFSELNTNGVWIRSTNMNSVVEDCIYTTNSLIHSVLVFFKNTLVSGSLVSFK